MHVRTRRWSTVLAVSGLAACTLFVAKPASAQTYLCTLEGVTFSGGGGASGSFDFNNALTNAVYNYNVAATASTYFSFTVPGYTYDSSTSTANGDLNGFDFQGAPDTDFQLTLVVPTISGPGSYAVTGYDFADDSGFQDFTSISGGEVKIAAVPEASSMVTFGILLTAWSALLIFRRRGRAAASSV